MTKAIGNFKVLAVCEGGPQHRLSSMQFTMTAVGNAIDTGLLLGGRVTIQLADPGVIASYAIRALTALPLMRRPAGMAVAHPTTGPFGAYAEHYVSPFVGSLVYYTYWAVVVFVTGAEMIAVAVYIGY